MINVLFLLAPACYSLHPFPYFLWLILLFMFYWFFLQILGALDPSFVAPLPLNLAYGDGNHYVEESTNLIGDAQELLVGMDQNNHVQEQPADRTLINLPVPYDKYEKSFKHENIGELSYTGESSKENPVDEDYLLDESFLDAMNNPLFGDGAFIETNDFKQPVEADPSTFDMLDEYLQFFDATDDNLQHMGFDYSNMMGNEVPSEPASLLPYKVMLHLNLRILALLTLTLINAYLFITLLSGCK